MIILKNILCIDFLSIVSFSLSKQPTADVRSILPSREHTPTDAFFTRWQQRRQHCYRPLQTSTSRCLSSSTLWICISYTRCCMTPQIVYNRRGLDPDCWGHNSGEMKSGVSLSFTVNLWLCLHMNRKAYLACNFDFRVETERFHKVACKQIRLTLQKRQCLRNNASYRRYTIHTVNRKWPMAHKIALFQMSLSDRWGHSPTAGLFKCVFRTFM